MPNLALIERHIRILIRQDVANVERIRAMLPPEIKPAPRKRAAKPAGNVATDAAVTQPAPEPSTTTGVADPPAPPVAG